jgi:crotonobetainyl-CoA:carnitine CoA-transferase CaiB-like acyl-CoA transferase
LNLSESITLPRSEWNQEVADALGGAMRLHSVRELVEKLRRADVWCEVCRTDPAEHALKDEALRRRGTVYEAVHPEYGSVHGLGALFSLSGCRMHARGAVALKGQHTREVLDELGYQPHEIDVLYERKIVA